MIFWRRAITSLSADQWWPQQLHILQLAEGKNHHLVTAAKATSFVCFRALLMPSGCFGRRDPYDGQVRWRVPPRSRLTDCRDMTGPEAHRTSRSIDNIGGAFGRFGRPKHRTYPYAKGAFAIVHAPFSPIERDILVHETVVVR